MKKLRNALLILFMFFINVSIVNATNLTIMPIDANEWGDSALLESNGEYLLIDATYGSTTNILDFLINKNVTRFSLYLSHYHDDHSGSQNKLTLDGKKMELMEYLIRNQGRGNYRGYYYTINTLYIPNSKVCEIAGGSCITKYNSLKAVANEMGVNIVLLDTGSTFRLGDTTANVLYMNTDASDFENAIGNKSNNCSLVTKFTNGSVKFLTAGDIEKVTEEKILRLGIDVSADIFKLNHHGLQYKNELSNNSDFVKAVNPKYSYVQFTENNKWSYKYKAIKTSVDYLNMSNYYNIRSNMYNTDVNGNIQFVIKDNKITPIAEKGTYQVKINYVDQDTNQKLSTKTYDFSYNFYGYELQYYLYDYEKTFSGYELGKTSDLKQSGVLSGNVEYNIYYKKIRPTKITLNTNTVELKVGETQNVKITKVEPSGAQCKNVTWSSSNKNVASVSSGNIQGLTVGKTTVTVNCDGIASNVIVTVKETIINETMILVEDETIKLASESKAKEWKTSNKEIATITQKGELKTKKAGTVTITAYLVNGNKQVWTVTVNKKSRLTKITLNVTEVELKVDESKTIKIDKIEPADAQCQNIVWTSSNKKVVTVVSGDIKGVSVGKATVTVNCDGIVSTVDITVKSITTNTIIELTEGEVIKLDTSNDVKEWHTSNKKIATINEAGELKALKTGIVTITANLNNGNKEVWKVTISKDKSGEAEEDSDLENNLEENPIEDKIEHEEQYKEPKFISNYIWPILIIISVIITSIYLARQKPNN